MGSLQVPRGRQWRNLNAKPWGLDLICSLSLVELIGWLTYWLCLYISKVLRSLLKLVFPNCSAALRTLGHPIHMWVDSKVKRLDLRVELNNSNQSSVSLKLRFDLLLYFSLNSLFMILWVSFHSPFKILWCKLCMLRRGKGILKMYSFILCPTLKISSWQGL